MEARSIASRLAMWSLIGSVLVLTGCGAALFGKLRTQLLESTDREGASLASGGASAIEAHIDRVTVATRLLARIVENRGNDAERLARDTLKANTDLAGVAFAFVPAKTDDPPPAPFVSRHTDGALSQRDLRLDATRYWEQPWFRNGIACDSGCWQKPFLSHSRQRRLVNYSVPIRPEGRMVGLVNADVTLDWLQGILGSLHKPAGATAFVLDGDGHYLAHDHHSLIGGSATQTLLDAQTSAKRGPVHLRTGGQADITEPSWLYTAPIPGSGWTLGLLVPEARIYAQLQRLFLLEASAGLLAMLGIALIIMTVARRTLAPLGILTDRAEHVARGELDFALPAVLRHDEIGRLTDAFDTMRRSLAEHIARLTHATREQERLRSELEIASQIQVALLPSEHYVDAHCDTFELHALLRPARAVGGDLYSYFMLDQQHFCLMVGDVSDKGIPAALFMARAITLAKAIAPRARRPSQLLGQLNQELCRSNEGCMFVTLLCGVLDTGTGRLVLASAGHEPPILCRDGEARTIEIPTGAAIGLDEDANYQEQAMQLLTGDTLLMYTDGITEASDHTQQMFGIERVLESLANTSAPEQAAGYTRHLLDDVDRFVGDAEQIDDITVMSLSWHHHGPQENSHVLELVCEATLPAVFDALDRCDMSLRQAGIADSTREDVRLVLEELMVNMVQHNHASQPDGLIRLYLHPSNEAIQVELHDNGTPFDPLQASPPTLTGDIADAEEIGGLGIHLVRAMASDMSHTHDSEGNHLQLRFIHPDHPESNA